ncbi:MAG: hypothetical protein NTW28_21710, partial [Candidatus Solibacter sp.]|nr:hypothetical protein [Candidatus Solibacter sp.]
MITRRGFLYTGVFGAGAAAGGLCAPMLRKSAAARLSSPVEAPRGIEATLALSLNGYEEEVRALFQTGTELPDPVRKLYGLNCIQGILLEPGGQVVLAGRHDAALPDMELDDLLVALRNAFRVSAEYQEPIGCTIDPIPGARDPWEIQSVRVLGMPFGAPMGDRHVEIDYELKRVGAGLKNLGPTVTSLYEMTRAESIPCQGGEQPAAPHSATHRFWFTPLYPTRKPRFLQDGGAIWIEEPIHVQVQSEEEFLDNGKRVGG